VAKWRAEHQTARQGNKETEGTAGVLYACAVPLSLFLSLSLSLCLSLFIAACTRRAAPQFAAASPSPSPIISSLAEDAPAQTASSGPRRLKITLTITRPEDLRVKVGDKVEAGGMIADRAAERERLEAQRRTLTLSARQLHEQGKLTDESLRIVRQLGETVPPTSFAAEEAAIVKAQAEADVMARKVAVQQQRIAALPLSVPAGFNQPLVITHEEQRFVNLTGEERQSLSEVALSRARLQMAKEARAFDEQRFKLSIAQQTLTARGQQQQMVLAAIQLQGQLIAINQQLALLAAVKAPFAGKVKRITWEEQRDHEIIVSVYLALAAADGRR
jgi:hypothetical protein